MTDRLDDEALALLFTEARSHNTWQDRPVTDADIHAIYELSKWGPTASNSNPGRFVFFRSQESKERLRPFLIEVNVAKTMVSPCVVMFCWDTEFYEKLPQLFPRADLRGGYVGNEALITETAFRSGTLQAAYFMMAARALGFDCGPMTGFDRPAFDKAFLSDLKWKSNILCNIAHGRKEDLPPRLPRPSFDEACLVL